MHNVVAVNGSPRTEKGNTALVLASFMEGMKIRRRGRAFLREPARHQAVRLRHDALLVLDTRAVLLPRRHAGRPRTSEGRGNADPRDPGLHPASRG